MSTPTQEPVASAAHQTTVKAQVATNAAAPSPASTPGVGGTGAAHRPRKRWAWLVAVTLLILVAGAVFVWAKSTGTDLGATLTAAWHRLTGNDLPEGFTQTNGRLEATKVYITTKAPLRVETILAREGDRVEPGQVLARMDTRTLIAQLHQAEAQIQRAKDTKITQEAVVVEREAEQTFWKSEVERERRLTATGASSREVGEGVYAKWKSAAAGLQAARSQVIEAQAAIEAAKAEADRLRVDINDGILVAPRRGRIQYRLAEQGEVLPAGGRVLDMIDLTDVYMLCYLPEDEAGKATIGAEARLVFDALPDVVIPATVYFVAAEAQFTPKAVETRTERQKLAFQVRARIDPVLLSKYEPYVKTGLPGMIYVRLDPKAEWPERLHVKIPEPQVPQP
jgi:HlyD family secretion protein